MSLSSDYLELDSAESLEWLGPVRDVIHNDDMVVLACEVNVLFQTHQKNWPWQEATVQSDSVSKTADWTQEAQAFLQKNKEKQTLLTIAKELVPLVKLIDPEKSPTLVSEVCKNARENDEYLTSLALANLGKNESEIQQKIGDLSPKQVQDLITHEKQQMQSMGNLELFQKIQLLSPHILSLLIETGISKEVAPEGIRKREFFKICRCYTQASKDILNRPGTHQLSEIKIKIIFAKRSNPESVTVGHYQVTAKQPGQWNWTQSSLKGEKNDSLNRF